MQALYRSSLAIVFQGRAEEVLPSLDKGSVDCVVTDPPYGQSYQSNRPITKQAVMAGDDGLGDVVGVLQQACTSLKLGRHLYVFGPDMSALLPVTGNTELIWDKGRTGMGNLSLPWGVGHERIGFMVRTQGAAQHAQGYGRLSARLRQRTVISCPRKGALGSRRHPTEKPVLLLRQLIESSTVLGETVLDPYSGVGSTAVAAVLAGRRAVAIEVDAGYCQTMVNRIKEAEGLALEMSRL